LIGFVFAESKRRIEVKKAAEIGKVVKGVLKVGVFVNQPLKEVQEIAEICNLDFVQLHGEETPAYCHLVGRPVIKAFRVGLDFTLEKSKEYQVDWLLLDSFTPGQYGGTGMTFDWQSMQEIAHQIHRPVMIAGGLTPENVGAAIAVLSPGGIDVSGGVETDGKKDIEKIQKFMIAARRAENGGILC
jgi:phosphoribosylanthranilate isomerase